MVRTLELPGSNLLSGESNLAVSLQTEAEDRSEYQHHTGRLWNLKLIGGGGTGINNKVLLRNEGETNWLAERGQLIVDYYLRLSDAVHIGHTCID